MKTRIKLITLELLGGMFDLIWICASIVLVYFLYGVLANDAPWLYLSWSLAIGFIAKQIAAALKGNKQRIDYVDQLAERGYEPEDAEAAWRTASGGGLNLLRNLQQADLSEQIDRLEAAINAPGAEGNSA